MNSELAPVSMTNKEETHQSLGQESPLSIWEDQIEEFQGSQFSWEKDPRVCERVSCFSRSVY